MTLRRDVHDVAVPLDRHHVGQLDRAEVGDAADVVAAQVDEHDVLGPLLGVGQQLLGEGLVLVLVAPAAARAGQRADRDLAVLDADHDLRRAADEAVVARRAGRT